MKTIILLILLFVITNLKSQIINVKSYLKISHKDLTLYVDRDTNSQLSIQYFNYTYLDIIKSGKYKRKDKWHNDLKQSPYTVNYNDNTKYDLGHLTPSYLTLYSEESNYNSFSLFNQAPQLNVFNRGKWRAMEENIVDSISKYKTNVIIITGVLYNNINKEYINKTRVKIPIHFFKILIIPKKHVYVWLANNDANNIPQITNIKLIMELSKKYKNKFKLTIKN